MYLCQTQHEQQVHDTHTCNARRLLLLRDLAQQPRVSLIMTGIACHRTGITEDCLARFTSRASSSPALLALLPLEDDVLRERPAPLRLDAQAAGLVIRV